MKMIRFQNLAQAILFENELLGQISDGYWENSGPRDHWKCFIDVKVTHAFHGSSDGALVGKNFRTSRRYNFANPMLLDCVGERMLVAVKLYTAFPNLKFNEHWDYPESLELGSVNLWAHKVFNPNQEKYYQERAARIRKAFPTANTHEELSNIIIDGVSKVKYDMKAMKKDLIAMNKIVNAGL